jgi:hypothetical protein
MLILASTSDKVQVVTSAAVATHVQASWVDNAAGTITPGRTNTAISTAVTTDVVGAPAASTFRNVKHLSVRPTGGAQTVTIQHTDGTTAVQLFKAALAQDECVIWMDGMGFQVLDATGALKESSQPSAGRFIKRTVYSTSGQSGNHTTDAKASSINVRMVGGGGGGGGAPTAATSAAVGSGGGAGSYAEKWFTVSPSTAYAFAVGAGATGGANTGAAGATGASSTFAVGGVTLTAPGGGPGIGHAAATTADTVAVGGAGGAVATNGDINGTGAPGDDGLRRSGTVGWSGSGGSSNFGGGGKGKNVAGAGAAGTGYGAGGGGGVVLNASAAVTGGAGTQGLIIVDEYA